MNNREKKAPVYVVTVSVLELEKVGLRSGRSEHSPVRRSILLPTIMTAPRTTFCGWAPTEAAKASGPVELAPTDFEPKVWDEDDVEGE